MVTNGGLNEQTGRHKAEMMNIGSDRAIGPREIIYTFDAGDLWLDMQLSIFW